MGDTEMYATTDEIRGLASKVEQLALQNRRLRRWLGALLLLPLIGVAMGAMQVGVSPKVATHRLEIIDPRGNPVLVIDGDDPSTRGPSVAYLDSNGRMRLAMGVANNQGSVPYIQFDDAQGRRVLNISTQNQPRPGIVRIGPNGQVNGVAP